MRVLVVTNLYPPQVLGGYELLARDVVCGLRDRGHEVDVLSSGEGDVDGGVWRTLTLVRPFGTPLGRERARSLVVRARNVRALDAYLASRGLPDAVLAMSQRRLGLDVLRALHRAGRPIVATVNDDWPLAYCRARPNGLRGLAGALLDRTVSRHGTFHGLAFSHAIFLSPTLRAAMHAARAPFPPGAIQPQGVDRRLFAPRVDRPIGSPLRLLFVGRLHPSKAPDAALDTVASLRRRGVHAELTVAGEAVSRGYGDELRARASALGITDAVRWLGGVRREDLPAIYRAADVFLFTGRFELEGQGLTHLEAMSCGVPVVAAAAGGARDLLAGSGAAVLARRCEGEDLADAVVGVIADEGRRRALIRGGLRLLEQSASLDRYVDAVESGLTGALHAA